MALNEFTIKARNCLQVIAIIGAQDSQRRQARDILMPKLMSGEIDVAEEIVPVNVIAMQFTEGMVAENGVPYSSSKCISG